MSKDQFDVLLVGGGVMGCATAYYLLKLEPRLNIALIEMDAIQPRRKHTHVPLRPRSA
jgi:glycine/D-amino acid oxidase-like deaminating enzyme